MSVYDLYTNSRTSSSINVRVEWTPSSSFYYKAYVGYDSTHYTSTTFGNQKLSANTKYTQTLSFSGLTSNTKYYFNGEMWYGDSLSSLSKGGATASAQIITYPATPSVSISANDTNKSVTVSWTQNQGGNAATITNKIKLVGSNGGTSKTVDNATSPYTFSNLSPGNYIAYVYANSAATTWDGKTDTIYSSSGTVTLADTSPTGNWEDCRATANADQTVDFSGTWQPTNAAAAGDYTLRIYLDGNLQTYPKVTGYASSYYSLDISGTTGKLSLGNHTIKFEATKDDFTKSKTITVEVQQTQAETPNGQWFDVTAYARDDKTVYFSGDFRQTSNGGNDWTLSVARDSTTIKTGTSTTLHYNETTDIFGTTFALSNGTYRFTFYARSGTVTKTTYVDVEIKDTVSGQPDGTVTSSASNITDTAATIQVTFAPNQGHYYKAKAFLSTSSTVDKDHYQLQAFASGELYIAKNSSQTFSMRFTGLSPNTKYYYRGCIWQYYKSNEDGWVEIDLQDIANPPNSFTTEGPDLETFTGTITEVSCTEPQHTGTNNQYQSVVSFLWTPNPSYRTSNYKYSAIVDLYDSPSNNLGGWQVTDIMGNETPKTITITITYPSTEFVQPEKKWYYRISVSGVSVDGSQPAAMTPNPVVSQLYQVTTPEVKPPLPKLFKWSWDYVDNSYNKLHGTASDSLLTRAHTAVTEVDPQSTLGLKGKTTEFAFSVWNDMVYWITDMQDRLDGNGSDPRHYDDSTKAMIVSSKDIIRASLWNALRTRYNDVIDKIGGSNSDYMPEVSVRDIIWGSLFTDLVDNVNKYVDAKNTAIDAENAARGW